MFFWVLATFLTHFPPLSGENKNTLKFSDGKVCKSFLIGCCPHDILASTVSNSSVRGTRPVARPFLSHYETSLFIHYSLGIIVVMGPVHPDYPRDRN